MALVKLGLRTQAFPFDWTRTTPAIVQHAISDDFVQYAALGQASSDEGLPSMLIEYEHRRPL
jgi:hypothetical protein